MYEHAVKRAALEHMFVSHRRSRARTRPAWGSNITAVIKASDVILATGRRVQRRGRGILADRVRGRGQ